MEYFNIVSLIFFIQICPHFNSIHGLQKFGKDCNLRQNEKCCDGFHWNITLEKCEKCEIGSYGPNCQKRCFYPYYGQDCQGSCACKPEECDFQAGCSSAQPNKDAAKTLTAAFQGPTDVTDYSKFPTKSVSKSHQNKAKVMEFNFQTLLIFGVFGGNGLTILIVLFVVSYCVKRKYTRYKTKSKTNSAINAQYQVISENNVASNINYRSVTTGGDIEISSTAQEPSTGIFVAHVNAPFKVEEKSVCSFDSRHRMSQTLPKGVPYEDAVTKDEVPENFSEEGSCLPDNSAYLTVVGV